MVYSILPESGFYCEDDALVFDNYDEAYEAALDWSVEDNGIPVIISKNSKPYKSVEA